MTHMECVRGLRADANVHYNCCQSVLLPFAQELGLEKRKQKAFTEAAAQLGVPPEQCTMFDDAPKNCLAARTAGM